MQHNVTVQIARVHAGAADIPLPAYATADAAGMDICAAVESDMVIHPGETVLIPTGFAIAVPSGYEAQVRPRSGLAIKHRIGIMNSPGTIDPDYRGEVKVILSNFGTEDFTVRRGDRIAQMVIGEVIRADVRVTADLGETVRAGGGFGSTGAR